MPTTNPQPPSADNRISAYLIYAGRTEAKQHLYYVLTDLQHNDGKTIAQQQLKPFYAEKKIFKNNRIGYITPITLINNSNSIGYSKETHVVAYWKTKTDLVQWRLTDAVADTIIGIEKLGDKNHLVDLLEPIARMYNRAASRQARNAIVAEVIRIITTKMI